MRFVDGIAEVFVKATAATTSSRGPPEASLRHLRAAARTEFTNLLESLLEATVGMKTACLYLRCLVWHMDDAGA